MAEMVLRATGSKLKIISEIHVTSTQANYDHCRFEFDEGWDNHGVRTAVFYSNPAEIRTVLLDPENRCVIPWDAFSLSRYLYIGVYGSNGTSYLPTQFVEITYHPGAMLDDHNYPPTPGIYEQIMATLSPINLRTEQLEVALVGKASNAALTAAIESFNERIGTKADLISTQGTLDALTAQMPLKADKAELQAVASGSPKGSYATLAALQTAKPSGDTGIYVVAADGKWYYWSGSAWTAGGVYQATAIGDGTVTYDKTAFGLARNVITPAITQNGYYYTNEGVKTANAGLKWAKIPVSPGQLIIVYGDFTGLSQVGIYVTPAGEYVSSAGYANNKYAMSSNSMVRCFVAHAQAGFLCLNMFVGRDYVYTPVATDLLRTGNSIDGKHLSAEVITADSEPIIGNLLPLGRHVPGLYYRNSVSGFYVNASLACYPPIDVSNCSSIICEQFTSAGGLSTFGSFFDSSWNYLSEAAVSSTDTHGTFSVPSSAKWYIPALLTAQVNVARMYRIKAQYERRIARSAIYPPLDGEGQFTGKLWVSYGDSITQQETWQPHVVAKYGMTHINLGIGSTKMAGAATNAMHQQPRIDQIIAANPDFVTILGGANDICDAAITIGTVEEFGKALANKDTMTFLGAYSKLVETLLTWKPTLRIIILGTTWAHGDGVLVRPAESTLTYTDFSEASQRVAAYYGLPFVDLHGWSGFNAFTMGVDPHNIYSNDQIHPNALGGERISELVINAFKESFGL